MNGVLDGTAITQLRDSIYLVNVLPAPWVRTSRKSRHCGSAAAAIGGRSVPLGAGRQLSYGLEPPTDLAPSSTADRHGARR